MSIQLTWLRVFIFSIGIAAIVLIIDSPVKGEATTHFIDRGIENPKRARVNYILQCQGCHTADATSSATGVPPMRGEVARFLHVPGGREYLARVPGVASAALNDAQLAEMLNWTLYTFDADHVPADFTPYTAKELGMLRATPLRNDAAVMRATLTEKFEKNY